MILNAAYLLIAGLGFQTPVRDLVKQLDGASLGVQRGIMGELEEYAPMFCHAELDPDLAEFGVPAIVARVSSSDKELARLAIRTLGRLGTQAHAAKPPLREALKDERRLVRIAAAQALARVSTVDSDLVLPVLMDAVSEPTIDLLLDFPYVGFDTAPAVPAVARLLEDSDLTMARLSASLLKNLGPVAADASEELLDATRHRDPEVRWQSLEALAECGCVPESFLAQAERLSKEDDDERVRGAAKVLTWFAQNGGGTPLDNLLNALNANEPRVRQAGVHGLRHYWPISDTARNALRQSTLDPDDEVSHAAQMIVWCPYEQR